MATEEKLDLFEVAVLSKSANNTVVAPRSLMASGATTAAQKALLMVPDVMARDVEDLRVLVRPFLRA